jgi:hypothetical protein
MPRAARTPVSSRRSRPRCRCRSHADASRAAPTTRSASARSCAPTTPRSAPRGSARPGFRRADGTLAPLALITLLDEAAFWLGALATGESGMTTALRVTLHAEVPADDTLTISGARAAVRAHADDARYWDTTIAAHDSAGRVVATAAITFVAVRGAARRLTTGMLAVNDAAILRRVFPAYVR